MASIEFIGGVRAVLYKKFGKRRGYFVKVSSKKKFVYEIKEFQARALLSKCSVFLVQKFFFTQGVKFLGWLLNFDIVFSRTKKEEKFTIVVTDKDFFRISVKQRPDLKVDEQKFVSLIKILFGIETYTQAKMVRDYEENDDTFNAKSREFRLVIMGKTLDFYVKNLEIIVVNLTNRYVLHYSNLEKKTWGNNPKALV